MLSLSMIFVIVNLTKFKRHLIHIMHSLCLKYSHPWFTLCFSIIYLSPHPRHSIVDFVDFLFSGFFVSLNADVYPEQIEYSVPHISVTVSKLESIPNLCKLFSSKLKNVTVQQWGFLPSS